MPIKRIKGCKDLRALRRGRDSIEIKN
jgi:hypothetical protein